MTYDDNNIFAKILRGEIPCQKIYETERVLAFMDVMPQAPGHVLVIPKGRVRNILDVTPDDLAHLIKQVQVIAKATKQAFEADGINVFQFNESAAGQTVFHLHFHVIPRYEGQPLRHHADTMEKPEVLSANADKIRAVLRRS